MTTEEIIEKYKDYLKKNDLKGFYDALCDNYDLIGMDIGRVTQYFYEMGANPLEYMDEIPGWFLFDIGIESFTIPSHIKEIGDCAFYGCKNLESIEIPDGIRTINNASFKNCHGLKSVKLPDSLEEISRGAFENCENLTDINVPKNLKEVGANAFWGCPQKTIDKFREFM